MAWKNERQPRAPLALAAAAFACGIWLAGYLQRPPALWECTGALLVVCALAAVLARSTRLAQLSAVLALLCAGAFARMATPVQRNVVPPGEFLDGERIEIVGHVTNDGVLLAGGGSRERFDLETEFIQLNDVKFARPFGIRATVFSREISEEDTGSDAPTLPRLIYGDRVKLKAKLRLPRNFRNPGAFDYEGYLRGIGISGLASVKAEEIEVLPGKLGSRFGFWRSRKSASLRILIAPSSLLAITTGRETALPDERATASAPHRLVLNKPSRRRARRPGGTRGTR